MTADLHTDGWRQGSMFTGTLPATALSVREGEVHAEVFEFSRGVVCMQDCDLRATPLDAEQPTIELRPVLDDSPPADWGIRSRRLRLADNAYVDADTPRCFVSPTLLTHFRSDRLPAVTPARTRAFKTWLGRRYDRPAVPDHLVDLARDIAKRCAGRSGRPTGEQVHDVLMQFDDAADPARVALFAVVTDDADKDTIRTWLGDAARRIRTDLGVVARIEVGTRAETSLHLLETSYAADLSQLTWGGEEPIGAK